MKPKAQISRKLLQDAQRALTLGRPEETLSLLAMSPAVLPVLMLRGSALAALARHEEAVKILAAVVRHAPSDLRAIYSLALCQKALGHFADARANLEKILKKQPGQVEVILNLNSVLDKLKRPSEQEKLLERGIALAPDEPRLRRCLAVLYYQRRRYEEALDLAESVAKSDPPAPESLNLLGLIQLNVGRKQNESARIEQAVTLFERALALAPEVLDYQLNYGAALMQREETAGLALAHFQELVEKHPGDSRIHHQIALALLKQGRLSEARSTLETAVACDPKNSAAQHRLSLVALALGDFETGSRAHAWRWRITEPAIWRHNELPVWDGHRLTAGRLLVWNEQGLGDELITYGWLPHLADRDIPFGVECDPRLVGLLQRAFPEAEIFAKGDERLRDLSETSYTAHCPCYDLLHWTRPWTADKRTPAPFLKSAPDIRETIAKRLAEIHEGPKIGLSWFSKGSPIAFGKSLALTEWAPILNERRALFVNLQYGDSEAEFDAACRSAGARGYSVPDVDRMNDIDGLCALIDSLDLVITIANVTGHFAGALGKPCWMLLGRDEFWHWGSQGESVPFYPSLKALRANELGGWTGVIETAAQRLKDRIEGR